MQERDGRVGYLYMALAVLTFSSSPIFVRWAAPLDALSITAGRMSFGSLAVILISLAVRRTWRPPPREDWARYVLYGLIAAAHFGFYIASLTLTTIAHALSITYTAPIWVTLFARVFLGESFPPRKRPGVVLTVIGIGILTGFEPTLDRRMIIGDLLALGGAVCFGLYSVAGRSQRERVPLFTYAATVYGLAGLWMIGPAWVAYRPGTLSGTAMLAVLGAAVFPLGIGHTLYNAALRRLHPTIVNVIATQEVTGGVLLGVLLLGEIPSPGTLIGSIVALAGVIWTLL
jgi:drug/metabolite transporter (DMT)-like permease